jgi:hypothetical protein
MAMSNNLLVLRSTTAGGCHDAEQFADMEFGGKFGRSWRVVS